MGRPQSQPAREVDGVLVKPCFECGEDKPLDFYYKNPSGLNGVTPRCKACTLRRLQNGYCSESRRARTLKPYGISVAEYDSLLAAQGGVCAICGAPPGSRRLAVDHDHETSAVRGLLCMPCNIRLGYYETMDVDQMQTYLNKFLLKHDQG